MAEASRRMAPGWTSAIAALLAAAVCSACTDEASTVGWTTVIDTVGGTVRVTNTPGTDTGPTLVADEEVRVGTLAGEGPQSFGLIRSIAVLDDGRFAVADAHAEEVRLFDREGQYLRNLRRPGPGPGRARWHAGRVPGP